MFIPKEFEVKDFTEIKEFIRQNPLGTIVSQTDLLEPKITHLPFLMLENDNSFYLEAHLALKNPHLEELKKGKYATLIFQGPDAYISSLLYEKENAPTWNYQAVHVFGTIEPLTNEELKLHLDKSVSHFEKDRKKQLEFKNLSPKMVEGMLKQIVGFRVIPLKMEAKYKLSQNRNEKDFHVIVDDLEKSNKLKTKALASEMKRTRK